jgi:hypothetical protein
MCTHLSVRASVCEATLAFAGYGSRSSGSSGFTGVGASVCLRTLCTPAVVSVSFSGITLHTKAYQSCLVSPGLRVSRGYELGWGWLGGRFVGIPVRVGIRVLELGSAKGPHMADRLCRGLSPPAVQRRVGCGV